MPGRLEHANITVADPKKTAAMLSRVFGWTTRWEGPGMETGYTVHVGGDDTYLALFSYGDARKGQDSSYHSVAGLNHVAIVVDDLDATEALVVAEGYHPKSHANYEPGRRFYFDDENGLEIEVVSYD